MSKFKPFDPVNIKVKRIYHEPAHRPIIDSQTCHYCKFLFADCKCDDQFFYDKYMHI